MAEGIVSENGNDAEALVRRSNIIYKNMKDPQILKYVYKFKTINLLGKESVSGSSPPDVFIGSFGYPNVYVGPMIPPTYGDTSLLSSPEEWVGKSIENIVEYRSSLVRCMYKTKVDNVENGKVENIIKELALSDKFMYADATLKNRPEMKLSFDENSQPFGPSAMLKEVEIGVGSTNTKIENAYSDTSMNAKDAILELYKKGVRVSRIQKALSAGILGVGSSRKFVPTRWSITAVDDSLGKANLSVVKELDPIDSYRVYYLNALDNRWVIIMAPTSWCYELVEAWYPHTTWNTSNENIEIFSSSELYNGRKGYAEIGGCYYAARLAVSEVLGNEKKQAGVAILRESHPGYILPVGVWNVREHVRKALREMPQRFSTLEETFNYAFSKLAIRKEEWIKNSTVLRYIMSQRMLSSY